MTKEESEKIRLGSLVSFHGNLDETVSDWGFVIPSRRPNEYYGEVFGMFWSQDGYRGSYSRNDFAKRQFALEVP